MKKINFYMLIACCLLSTKMLAQYIPAVNPDFIYPPFGIIPARTQHLSCFDYPLNAFGMSGNFNAYSWCNDDPAVFNNSGIAFSFTDNTNSVIFDQGYINLSVSELEIALISTIPGQMYVVASYENFGAGVYADIYQYSSLGTLTPLITGVLLDATGSKPRISQLHSNNIAIVYESPMGIGVNTFSIGAGLSATCYIAGSAGGIIPDISINATSNVYIAYFSPSANAIMLESLDYNTIATSPGLTPFNFVDQLPVPNNPNYIDLDSWNFPSGVVSELWAYAYDQQNDLNMRLFNSAASATPMDIQLTNAFLSSNFIPKKPSLTFDLSADLIDIAWSQEMFSGITNPTIGLQVDNLGNIITPGSNYLEVQQTITGTAGIHLSPLVVLSKNKYTSLDIFCAFSLDYTNPVSQMNFKFKSAAPSTTYVTEQINNQGAQIYPNPFNNILSLFIDEISSDDIILLRVFDITGKCVLQINDNINEVNFKLRNEAILWSNGMYIFDIQNGKQAHHLKVIKQ